MHTPHPLRPSDDVTAELRASFEAIRAVAEQLRIDVGNLERSVDQAQADTGSVQAKLQGYEAQIATLGHDVVSLRTGMLALLDDLDRLFPIVGPAPAPRAPVSR